MTAMASASKTPAITAQASDSRETNSRNAFNEQFLY
jgi:hypothetical protein